MMKHKIRLHWNLFISTFYLSAFTFGGGYVIISLMQKKFVDEKKWLEEEEMLNVAAIAQSSPGAIAVNAAILIGYRILGISGAIVSIIGTVLPPLLIISILSFFYDEFRNNGIVSGILKGMQAGVAAVIADVVISLSGNVIKDRDWVSILVMIFALVSTYLLHIDVIAIIVLCGIVGALKIRYLGNEGKKR